MILARCLAGSPAHEGKTEAADAMAACVSVAFIFGTLAMTSPVAGFNTCEETLGLPHAVSRAPSSKPVFN